MMILCMLLVKLNHLIVLILKQREKKYHGMILEGKFILFNIVFLYIITSKNKIQLNVLV